MRTRVASILSAVVLVASASFAGCSMDPPKPAQSPDPTGEDESSSHSSHSSGSSSDSDPEPVARRSAPVEAPDPHAKGKKDDVAPTTKKAIPLSIPGLAFGQSPKQVGAALDKLIDADYAPQYKDVQPGIKMKELDAQIAEDKSQFRRSRIDFGKLPTGVDSTPLRGEYSYNNKEAMMSFTRKGEVINLFFIQEGLWKIIVEKPLGDGAPLGKTYMDAVVKLSANYGVPGRVLQPDGTSHFAVEVDWRDASIHLRAIQRSDTALGLCYEDNGTLASLGSLRPNKVVVDNGIDPEVAAAMANAPASDPAKDKDKDKKKKKKK